MLGRIGSSGLLAVLLGSAAVLMAAPVAAQQASDVAVVEDTMITVVARKREETLLDVPGAVSALGAAELDRLVLNGNGTADLLRQLPSVTLVSQGPEYSNEISIRGQGGGRVGFSEAATGVYYNGHYVAGGGFGGRGYNQIDLFDLERIEVLRGPQGALYGRNAVGGTVNVISARPTRKWSVQLGAGYNDVDRITADFVVNMPFGKNAGLRVAALLSDQRSGFVTLQSTGQAIDTSRMAGFRATLEADLTEKTQVTLQYQLADSRSTGFANNGYRPARANLLPLDPDRFVRNMDRVGLVNIEEHSGYLTLTHDFDFARAEVRGSVRARNAGRFNEDLDHFLGFQGNTAVFPLGTAARPIDLVSEEAEDFVRAGFEFLLTSPKTTTGYSWLFGLEYQHNDFDVDLATTGFAGAAAGLRAQLRLDESTNGLNSVAAFGAVEVELAPRLTMGVEGRLQCDTKSFGFDRRRNVPDSLVVEILGVSLSESWTRVTPAATLNYKASEDASLYARVASAYRPGGFNLGIPVDIVGAGNLIPYDPETVVTYEAGGKIALADNRLVLEAAGYYSDTRGVQIVTQPSASNTTFILQNGVGTRTWGFEFSARGQVKLGPGTLVGRLELSTSDGTFKDGTSAIILGQTISLAGLRVNRTRNLYATANLNYSVPVSGRVDLFLGGSYQGQTGGFENAENSRRFDAYHLFDGRIGLRGEGWTVSVFGQNLGNSIYRIQSFSGNEFFNQQRIIGMRTQFNF